MTDSTSLPGLVYFIHQSKSISFGDFFRQCEQVLYLPQGVSTATLLHKALNDCFRDANKFNTFIYFAKSQT